MSPALQILLIRHGNTFGPGEPAVMVGSRNDLPLVESGLEQARACAAALKASGLKPAAVFCGPLKRTRLFAQIISTELGLSMTPRDDVRLRELDYGDWTGLTDRQIAERFGEAALKAWSEKSVPPAGAGWAPAEEEIVAGAKSFCQQVAGTYGPGDAVAAVSSNGILRYFLKLVEGEFEKRAADGTFKVKTGHVGKLTFEDGRFSLAYWNVKPGEKPL